MKVERVKERIGAWRRKLGSFTFIYAHNKAGIIGLIVISFFIFIAISAPLIAPYDPHLRIDRSYLSPSSKYILGTNDIGQDIFSELMYGARVSLFIGFAAAVSVVVVGTVIGLVAGYLRGAVDELLMRICDIILVLPTIPLMILLAAILGRQNFYVMILAITVTAWPGPARMVRSVTLSLRERTFVEASRAVGAGDAHIMLKHILPNTLPLILSMVIYEAADAMMAEASLSFLGLGDPGQKSWGMMLHYVQKRGGWFAAAGLPAWWWIIPPGLCIAFTILSLVLIGQAIEEIVNPRLRRH